MDHSGGVGASELQRHLAGQFFNFLSRIWESKSTEKWLQGKNAIPRLPGNSYEPDSSFLDIFLFIEEQIIVSKSDRPISWI